MIYQNDLITVSVEPSEIPWVKIFTKRKIKEFSECTLDEKSVIIQALDIIEKLMLDYFQADKINITSFGNLVPQVHWHIMARFKSDSYFPEPMWGKKQRESKLDLPDFELFFDKLNKKLRVLG